jgi:hypothetical protein
MESPSSLFEEINTEGGEGIWTIVRDPITCWFGARCAVLARSADWGNWPLHACPTFCLVCHITYTSLREDWKW